jgi:hypothetical protein
MAVTASSGRQRRATKPSRVRQLNAPNSIDRSKLERALTPSKAVQIINYDAKRNDVLITRKGKKKLTYFDMIITVTSPSGAFTDGEEITDGAGNTGTLVHYGTTPATSKELFFVRSDDEGWTGTITGTTSTETATFSSLVTSFNNQVCYTVIDGKAVLSCNDGTNTFVFEYDITNDALTLKKEFATTTGKFVGISYAQWFFGSNGSDKIGYYDHEAGGAWTQPIDANAPKSTMMTTYQGATAGASFLVTNDVDSPKVIKWSEGYTNSAALPWQNWTQGSPVTPTGASERIIGEIGGFNLLIRDGHSFIVFGEEGTVAMKIDYISDSTQLVQKPIFIQQEENLKDVKAAIYTPFGILAVNEKGWFIVKFTNNRTMDYEITKVLSVEEMSNFDVSDAAITFDGSTKAHLFLRKNSATNNYGFTYDLEEKELRELQGMDITDTCSIKNDMYGMDSRKFAFYKLFDGNDDDGRKIRTTIKFPKMTLEDISELLRVLEARFFGVLENSTMNITINTWDRKGDYKVNTRNLEWDSTSSDGAFGMGVTGLGLSGIVPYVPVETDDIAFSRVSINNVLAYQVIATVDSWIAHEFRALHMVEQRTGIRIRSKKI